MSRKKSVYEIVTERIMEKLEQGIIPWRKPWAMYPAVNWVTQRPYRGLNQMLLEPGEYATWNQVKKAGGKVKKGAKSGIVCFWRMIEVEEEEKDILNARTGQMERHKPKKKIPFLRYYRVFNIRDCEGLEPKQEIPVYDHDPIERAEEVIEGYPDCPQIAFAPGRAFYRPSDDTISIPEKPDFEKAEEYYSTLFHEAIHSTGHKNRLARSGILEMAGFGSHEYSKEELVAEIGAAMLCGEAGIVQETLDNSTAYIQSWLKALDNDKKLVVFAASQAQKAADYVLSVEQGNGE